MNMPMATPIGYRTLPPSLINEARKKGWIVIGMKDDWKQIFAFEP